ncbi:MAG: hypothetical protein BWK76_18245 [Desulfobulbaceae bacterium A2]|nr:MAG: hypothetical protein BWK76_18245 [Desulfobulbaceae bacterium A2]
MSPAFIWFLVGFACLLLELALPGFIIFFFGVGAWITALACLAGLSSLSLQLLCFAGASLACLFSLRSWLRKTFVGRAVEPPPLEGPVGAMVEVVENINPPAEGRVKYSGSFWRAAAELPIPAGTMVRVLSREGLLLRVLHDRPTETKE